MSLETTFESLRRELGRLEETVSALHVTVTEDKPARGDAVLVDWLDNLVTDLASALEEADARAGQAIQGSQPNGPLDQTRIALREIHGLINRFTASYVGELATHESIARLLQMGRERGREWQNWTGVVKTAIERCAVCLGAVQGALLGCWDELTERLVAKAISIRSTNIGQQITMREDQLNLEGNAA
jgi:hypothetical protein